RHGKGEGFIPFTPEAKSRWEDYYLSAMPQSVHAKRLDTYAFKWMLLLALSQEQFEITTPVVDEAIKLIDYQLAVRKLYDPIDADNAHAKMEEKIRRYLRAAAPRFVSNRAKAIHERSSRWHLAL